MAGRRRRFGLVRKLPSGKWQASFIGPGGVRQTAPDTFLRRTDADRWLAQVESDISRGVWLDGKLGRVLLGDYARAYLRDTPSMGSAGGRRVSGTCGCTWRRCWTGRLWGSRRWSCVSGTQGRCGGRAAGRRSRSPTDSYGR